MSTSTTAARHRWIDTAEDSAAELGEEIETYLDRARSGEASADEYRRLERSAIETLIAIRDAGHMAGVLDDEANDLAASEKLIEAADAVDGSKSPLAVERIEEALERLEKDDSDESDE